jgi:hypothetical protein
MISFIKSGQPFGKTIAGIFLYLLYSSYCLYSM